MHQIVFVCHGNICRSPMAEFVMKHLVKKAGRMGEFEIESRATSTEEIGNPVHPGTKRILNRLGISTDGKRATQLRREDYDAYDYFIGMDRQNMQNMMRIFGSDPEHKLRKLNDTDVADPWYTGDFEQTYEDILQDCERLLKELK